MWNFERVLITGGAGFIGGTLVRRLLLSKSCKIFNIDNLNYASNISSISSIKSSSYRHKLIKVDIYNSENLSDIIYEIKPDLIVHLAAESHVDRSIENPAIFINSNIIGTFNLLEASRKYWEKLDLESQNKFIFHHVSTDEVFGSAKLNEKFDENSKYYPNSPYSASKASSDHLVRSWNKTYGLPTVITNCSNNYGPYQFPEKLIPHVILKAINNQEIPIYGDGKNIRDWLHVEDHISALLLVQEKALPGEYFCIGGNEEKTNLELVNKICELLDIRCPMKKSYKKLIKFVQDRPGHDMRYSINSEKLETNLKWVKKYKFEEGIKTTIDWYVDNISWCENISKKANYKGERLGVSSNNQ